MNRQVKALSIVTIISCVFVIILFFVALSDYNYNILVTLKNYWIMFLFPLPFALITKRFKKISEFSLKDIYAQVITFKKEWDYHGRNTYYTATFKVYSDLLWTFEVPEDIFNKLVIGQHGILSYREKGSKVYFAFFSSLDNQDNGNQSTSDKQ